ncbi:MAG TPA: hypothetical protein VG674_06255 [Amycolatopsis sp.]|nr:hypothetical protein [Amycolatopsis sp.]
MVPAEDVVASEDGAGPAVLDERLAWCLSAEGRSRAAADLPDPAPVLAGLVDELARDR